MSNAHSDCAKAIREQLARAPFGLTKHGLYNAVDFHRKGEAVFGACLSAMLQAGDLAELREPMQLTRYTLKGNAPHTTVAMQRSAERQQDAESYRHHHAPTEHQTRTYVKNADVASMRQQIVDAVEEATAPMLTDEITAALPNIGRKRVREYTQVLRKKGLLQSRSEFTVAGFRRCWWWPASKPWPQESEAPTAAPVSAPSATPAPGGAADLHPELQAIGLRDWEQLDKLLDDARARAFDARHIYIESCTEAAVMKQLDGAIESTTNAQLLHRKRRPA